MFETLLTRLRDGSVPLYLAPQAGVSESPFRRLCRRSGADVVVSEFVSAEGVRRGSSRTLEYLRFDDAERPIGVQIFGADPVAMAEAAAFIEQTYQPDFIDINFGCPAKKVVRRNGGSGCLRDLDLVERIIRAVAASVSIPTTVKVRSGWSDASRNPVEIGLRCQDAGARVLTLHARSRTQMFSGHSDWGEIAAVVDALEIPVVGNGDVWCGEDARRMHDQTGCAGVMIARGSHGAPWIFAQARAALAGRVIPPDPDIETRFAIVLEHARNAIEFEQDEARAVRDFRKHLGWYTKGLPDGRRLREQLHSVSRLEDAERLLARYQVDDSGSVMTRERVLELLEAVAAGSVGADVALKQLAWLPVESLAEGGEASPPYARLDHHRSLRTGHPEVVYCPGKTVPQIVEICWKLADHGAGFLATRAEPEVREALATAFPSAVAHELGRIVHLSGSDPDPDPGDGLGVILVASGGTADMPVAEEAAVTAAAFGNPVERLYDVGVAGIHRLLRSSDALGRAAVVIAVAGMEGALPSVISGLVAAPVVAVPTSTGYGASFGGLAALLAMLNSCAAGLTVVNIDNGYGAACAAHRMNRLRARMP